MQTIIIREKLQITGLTGNGSKTLEVWTDFDSRFTTNPFTKADETGYEIRFWQNRKTRKAPDQNKSDDEARTRILKIFPKLKRWLK